MTTTIKSAAIGLLTLLAVTTGFTATAGNETPGSELKIAGKLNNQPVFQLNLNNKENSKFAIVVKDDAGEVLFQEVVSGINISRKFQLNNDELAGVNIKFEVIDLKNYTSTIFKVNNDLKNISEAETVKN